MGDKKDSYMVGKNQYLEQGMVFNDTPEIMTKIIDMGYTGITTAKAKETDEKWELWNVHPHPLERNTFKPVVFKNPDAPDNPYDRPGEDFTTPISNYPTEVVLTNSIPTVGHVHHVGYDPILDGLYTPIVNEHEETQRDEVQNQFIGRLKEINNLKQEIKDDLDDIDLNRKK